MLNLFVAVMRQGSFAAVARDRNVDPSSVSRAIAALEAELGVRLFQRTTRKLSPTEAGTTYFAEIEPLVEEIERAGDLVKDSLEQVKGRLRVTASVAFGLKCIVPILSDFEAQYPDVSIDLLLTDSVVDLLSQRVDLAIRLGLLEESTLMARRLMPVQYRVCASGDYLKRKGMPSKPDDIAQHDCLCFPLAGFCSRWIFRHQNGQLSKVAVRGRTVISNAIALQQCAISSMGLALLPHWLVDDDLMSGKLVDVFSDYEVTATDFNTAAWFVYPSRSYIPLKVKTFMAFLSDALS